jgi:hypothetical protein
MPDKLRAIPIRLPEMRATAHIILREGPGGESHRAGAETSSSWIKRTCHTVYRRRPASRH